MIYTGLNRTGEIETVKAHGGYDVAEVYGGINESNPIYYKTRTLTGTSPLSYKALSKPLSDYLISGNTVQNGTPTPSDPVDVVGCGVRTGNLADEKIQNAFISANGIVEENIAYDLMIIPVIAGSQYTFYYRNDYGQNYVVAYYVEKPILGSVSYNSSRTVYYYSDAPQVTITVPSGVTYIAIRLPKNGELMLNLGSTALPYEPYGFKLPFTVNGQEIPIYLGQAPTTRRIKKAVLTGEEEISGVHESSTAGVYCASMRYSTCGATDIIDYNKIMANIVYPYFVCSHLKMKKTPSAADAWYDISEGEIGANSYSPVPSLSYNNLYFIFCIPGCTTKQDFQDYFASQYAEGTPVTIWYILAEPETGIVNEPLHKIGDYADTVSMAQAGVTIPTIAGTNTLTVDTTVQPSAVSITGNIKEVSR